MRFAPLGVVEGLRPTRRWRLLMVEVEAEVEVDVDVEVEVVI